VTGRRHGKAALRDFNSRLRLQEEKYEQKEKIVKEKKLKASMETS
jgi:membrane protein DedA with SNARE-associated domain